MCSIDAYDTVPSLELDLLLALPLEQCLLNGDLLMPSFKEFIILALLCF